MPRQARQFGKTGYSHVIVRGIGRQLLFEESYDYRHYINLLKKYSGETGVTVCAYCLMENHVHLLLHDASLALPAFMKKLGVSYSAYFNKKYERTGHLFQDRYRSEPVDDDAYLLTVYRYILKNPEKAGISPAKTYPWSSYLCYGDEGSFVDTFLLKQLIGNSARHDAFIAADESADCLEYDTGRLNDAKAKEAMISILGTDNGTVLQSYNRVDRNAAVEALAAAGLSERQIERLTGISRRVIHMILW